MTSQRACARLPLLPQKYHHDIHHKKKILEQEIQKHRTDTVGITRANRREVCEKLAEYLVSANDPAVRTYLQKVLDEISVSNEDVMIKMNIA